MPGSADTHGSGVNVYPPPSDADGSRTRTTLDEAMLQARGIERSKSERSAQSELPQLAPPYVSFEGRYEDPTHRADAQQRYVPDRAPPAPSARARRPRPRASGHARPGRASPRRRSYGARAAPRCPPARGTGGASGTA